MRLEINHIHAHKNIYKKKRKEKQKQKSSVSGPTMWILCAETKYDWLGNQLQASTVQEARSRRSRPHQDESGRWVCNVCGKTYNRGDSLAHHRSIHRGDTVCPICQTVFTRKYTMRCHMLNVHGVK